MYENYDSLQLPGNTFLYSLPYDVSKCSSGNGGPFLHQYDPIAPGWFLVVHDKLKWVPAAHIIIYALRDSCQGYELASRGARCPPSVRCPRLHELCGDVCHQNELIADCPSREVNLSVQNRINIRLTSLWASITFESTDRSDTVTYRPL